MEDYGIHLWHDLPEQDSFNKNDKILTGETLTNETKYWHVGMFLEMGVHYVFRQTRIWDNFKDRTTYSPEIQFPVANPGAGVGTLMGSMGELAKWSIPYAFGELSQQEKISMTGVDKYIGSDNLILDDTSRTGLGDLRPWDMSDATPKGRRIRFSFDIDSAAAVGASSQINFYNKTTGDRTMGDVLAPFPFGKSTHDMVTVIPEGFDQISFYLNAPSTTISNLYLRDSPDYSSLEEQLVHDEFWLTLEGERKQVYMRTFVGSLSHGPTTILAPYGGFEAAKVVVGYVSSPYDAASAVTEKSSIDHTGDGPYYWEVNVMGYDYNGYYGVLEILTPFSNMGGLQFSITIKYIKL